MAQVATWSRSPTRGTVYASWPPPPPNTAPRIARKSQLAQTSGLRASPDASLLLENNSCSSDSSGSDSDASSDDHDVQPETEQNTHDHKEEDSQSLETIVFTPPTSRPSTPAGRLKNDPHPLNNGDLGSSPFSWSPPPLVPNASPERSTKIPPGLIPSSPERIINNAELLLQPDLETVDPEFELEGSPIDDGPLALWPFLPRKPRPRPPQPVNAAALPFRIAAPAAIPSYLPSIPTPSLAIANPSFTWTARTLGNPAAAPGERARRALRRRLNRELSNNGGGQSRPNRPQVTTPMEKRQQRHERLKAKRVPRRGPKLDPDLARVPRLVSVTSSTAARSG
ncbi:hypothetical protein BC828DRAFT_379069, partial [Blastocladiella britannica]